MAHSNQIREFMLTGRGVQLLDVYQGAEGVLTGTARLAQEAKERADVLARQQEIERAKRELERKRHALEAQINALRADFRAEEEEMKKLITEMQGTDATISNDEEVMRRQRGGDHETSMSIDTLTSFAELPEHMGGEHGTNA
jgi:circadian clock protein KaiC